MFYRPAIYLTVSVLPLNFISVVRTRNFYIIFRLKNNTNGPTFGSLTPLKLMTLSKCTKTLHIGIFLKIYISEPRARSRPTQAESGTVFRKIGDSFPENYA